METVKVFQSGNSQAVIIPTHYKIDEKELLIRKIGSSFILTPKDLELLVLKNCLA